MAAANVILQFQRYKKLNVRVQEKDGEALLMEIVDNVQRMLDRKMDAVKVSSKFFPTCSSVFSLVLLSHMLGYLTVFYQLQKLHNYQIYDNYHYLCGGRDID